MNTAFAAQHNTGTRMHEARCGCSCSFKYSGVVVSGIFYLRSFAREDSFGRTVQDDDQDISSLLLLHILMMSGLTLDTCVHGQLWSHGERHSPGCLRPAAAAAAVADAHSYEDWLDHRY